MIKKKPTQIECEESCGNVFADLGLPNPEEALAKSQMVWEITKIIRKRELTQIRTAQILNLTQPQISRLLRGYLIGFSLEQVSQFLEALTSLSHLRD